jgi:hypothetical protein
MILPDSPFFWQDERFDLPEGAAIRPREPHPVVHVHPKLAASGRQYLRAP